MNRCVKRAECVDCVKCFQVSGECRGTLSPQKKLNKTKHGALYKCMILVDRLTEGPGWYNWQLECGDGPSGLKDLFLFVLFQGPLGLKIRKKEIRENKHWHSHFITV